VALLSLPHIVRVRTSLAMTDDDVSGNAVGRLRDFFATGSYTAWLVAQFIGLFQ
jgi:hypothetical protein